MIKRIKDNWKIYLSVAAAALLLAACSGTQPAQNQEASSAPAVSASETAAEQSSAVTESQAAQGGAAESQAGEGQAGQSQAGESGAAGTETAPAASSSESAAAQTEAEEQSHEVPYTSENGWTVLYDEDWLELKEEDPDTVQFTYKGDAADAGQVVISYVAQEQPTETLYKLTESWTENGMAIRRTEGRFPGTTDKWGFWREFSGMENGKRYYRTAIAGEYNDGVLVFESVEYKSGNEAEDMAVSDLFSSLLNSISYEDFRPQVMYEYVPGTYQPEAEGELGELRLNPDHTGILELKGEDKAILWGSIELMAADGSFTYEYDVEGENLLIHYQDEWLSFEKQPAAALEEPDPDGLHVNSQPVIDSPDWVKELPSAKDGKVKQLFITACLGMDKTTAWVSMHEKDEKGEWKQILSTPAFIGMNGACADEDHKEGCAQTPLGIYYFNKAFGIADDPGCALPYIKVNDNTYWSGDEREGMHYNEMVDITDYPDLDMTNSEHIVDYEYQYQYCLNYSFNEDGTPGRGSALFLHCMGLYKPYTGGCIAIPENIMKMVMQKVDPECVVVIDTMESLGAEF